MIRWLRLLWLLAPIVPNVALAQTYDTVRIATYNVLNYSSSSSDTASRNPEFRKILRAIDPDLIVTQEVLSASSATGFLNNVLNAGRPGTYAAAPFSDGPDTDNSMFYKLAKFSFVAPQTVLHTALRDINGYRLRPVGVTADSLDIQIYSAHLKASTGYEAQRGAEAETLRTHLNSLTPGYFVSAGDFNLYTSTEPAFSNLTGSRANNIGRLYDPINTSGTWHDGASFAGIHTQATRLSEGGMDDRFDFALLSYAFQGLPGWEYVPGSYTEFGNDGNHFNQSINSPPNGVVPDSIANALYNATDHLPVYLEVRRQIGGAVASITVSSPNGGETWNTGSAHSVLWSSQNLTGTVTLKLNRGYPGGTWETLFAGVANSGTQSWTVTAPVTTAARIQIVSDSQPSLNDVSDANFAIQSAGITLLTPNGGETWTVGQTGNLAWSSTGISGNVRIEIDRSYPSGNWEILYGSAVNDGSEPWSISGPATSHARMRIYSVNTPVVGDTSNADFTVASSAAPVVLHERHGDAEPGAVTFTARVSDDLPGVSTKLFYRLSTANTFDSLTMSATGDMNEYAASPTLFYGHWWYFIRATDSEGQTSSTDTCEFVVASPCGLELSYNDTTAEVFNWSATDSMAWAVRFTPSQVPFTLCDATVAVATFHPDSSHTPVRVRVYAADGAGGMPGTLITEVTRGSIGNMIGGFASPGARAARFVLQDDVLPPLTFNSDFYVAVLNSGLGVEAFGMDTSSTYAGRSVVLDPCTHQWLIEDGSSPTTRRGNRMIGVRGWRAQPVQVVIWKQNNDVELSWSSTGAVYYRVYKSLSSDFANPQLVGTTSDTALVLVGEFGLQAKAFYWVVASTAP